MTAETPPPSIPSAPTDTTTETPSFPQAFVVSSSVPRLVSKLWWITGLSLVIAFVLVMLAATAVLSLLSAVRA